MQAYTDYNMERSGAQLSERDAKDLDLRTGPIKEVNDDRDNRHVSCQDGDSCLVETLRFRPTALGTLKTDGKEQADIWNKPQEHKPLTQTDVSKPHHIEDSRHDRYSQRRIPDHRVAEPQQKDENGHHQDHQDPGEKIVKTADAGVLALENVLAHIRRDSIMQIGTGMNLFRFDELFLKRNISAMNDAPVFEVQRLYPQIYLACHVDHVKRTSTVWHLTSQDSAILAHLDTRVASSPRSLARHLGVRPSTLSAALKRLAMQGYIKSIPARDDNRKREIFLTPRGEEAMAATSVLDGAKVEKMLSRLDESEIETAIRGLSLLARAARDAMEDVV